MQVDRTLEATGGRIMKKVLSWWDYRSKLQMQQLWVGGMYNLFVLHSNTFTFFYFFHSLFCFDIKALSALIYTNKKVNVVRLIAQIKARQTHVAKYECGV